MRLLRALLCAAALSQIVSGALAQQSQGTPSVPVFRSTTTLVFLDATVLDKKGQPVVTGLTKDDFTITEDKKPQSIFSFEAPEMHKLKTSRNGSDNPDGSAPVTIFVLDLLNSNFEDFAYIRYSVQKYLEAQPAQLSSPAEMMVIGNESLELLQGFTRSRTDLLFALKHLPGALPFKFMRGSFFGERFGQSIDALQQIALQSKGVPGRKNIVWVGHGGPSVNTVFWDGKLTEQLDRYVHETANMLVDARISLFVIYPGLPVSAGVGSRSAMSAQADPGNTDPFAGDINFGVFVNETGGNLYYNRNDVDMEIKRSQELGSEYYTLTYQPQDEPANGKFRRIRVSLRDPNLHAVTKTGYFAPDEHAPLDARQESIVNLAEAVRSTIPFKGMEINVSEVTRHPDTRSAEMAVLVRSSNLDWQPADNGESKASVLVGAASRTDQGEILASKLERVTLTAQSQDAAKLAVGMARVHVVLRVPPKTRNVRVVMQSGDGGRIGAADLTRAAIDAAPATPTPNPQFMPQRPEPKAPPSP
jgi:VWFA-related protein